MFYVFSPHISKQWCFLQKYDRAKHGGRRNILRKDPVITWLKDALVVFVCLNFRLKCSSGFSIDKSLSQLIWINYVYNVLEINHVIACARFNLDS